MLGKSGSSFNIGALGLSPDAVNAHINERQDHLEDTITKLDIRTFMRQQLQNLLKNIDNMNKENISNITDKLNNLSKFL